MIVVKSTQIPAQVNVAALQAAIVASALGAQYIDANQTDNGASFSVYLQNAVANQQSILDTLCAAHDPVFLSADKTTIASDGVAASTISVSAPKAGAAPITLVITPALGAAVTQLVTMAAGLGSVQIKTLIPGSLTVTVQSGTNRNVDNIAIQAV